MQVDAKINCPHISGQFIFNKNYLLLDLVIFDLKNRKLRNGLAVEKESGQTPTGHLETNILYYKDFFTHKALQWSEIKEAHSGTSGKLFCLWIAKTIIEEQYPNYYDNFLLLKSCTLIFLNGPSPASSSLFASFQTNITILQQINVKNVHPVSGPGFKITTFWLRAPPLTTRPGLLP